MDGQINAEQCAHDAVLAAGPLVIEEVFLDEVLGVFWDWAGHGHSIAISVGSGLISTPGRGS